MVPENAKNDASFSRFVTCDEKWILNDNKQRFRQWHFEDIVLLKLNVTYFY